jgi:hypothetical protein
MQKSFVLPSWPLKIYSSAQNKRTFFPSFIYSKEELFYELLLFYFLRIPKFCFSVSVFVNVVMPTVISRLTLIRICGVFWIFQWGKIAPWGRNHASCLLFEKIQFDTATPYVHRKRNWGYVAVLQCQIKCNSFMETDGQYKSLYRGYSPERQLKQPFGEMSTSIFNQFTFMSRSRTNEQFLWA